MRRASRSAAPPGGKLTTSRMGWAGQVCASDVDVKLTTKASAIAMALMFVSPDRVVGRKVVDPRSVDRIAPMYESGPSSLRSTREEIANRCDTARVFLHSEVPDTGHNMDA